MFEQTFKNIDDVLWKEAGCATELDYTEQTSWILFLKYLDDLEKANEQKAELAGKKYERIIDTKHRWSVWAAPKKKDGSFDHDKALTGDDLIKYVDEKLFPYLKGFRTRAEGANTIEYKIGEIFSEIENKFRSGYRTAERQVFEIEQRLAVPGAATPERERDVRMLASLTRTLRDLSGLGDGEGAPESAADESALAAARRQMDNKEKLREARRAHGLHSRAGRLHPQHAQIRGDAVRTRRGESASRGGQGQGGRADGSDAPRSRAADSRVSSRPGKRHGTLLIPPPFRGR